MLLVPSFLLTATAHRCQPTASVVWSILKTQILSVAENTPLLYKFCLTVQETTVRCRECFDLILEMQSIMVSISENQMNSCGSSTGPMNKII